MNVLVLLNVNHNNECSYTNVNTTMNVLVYRNFKYNDEINYLGEVRNFPTNLNNELHKRQLQLNEHR